MNPHPVSTIVLVAHWLIVLGLSVRVIMRRAPVGVSLAWLTVAFSVPFAGAALYLLFGEKRLGRTRRTRLRDRIAARSDWLAALRVANTAPALASNSAGAVLLEQARGVSGFPALQGNSLELLAGSEAFFDRLVRDIDAAQRSVHLEFYIWQSGGRVDEVVAALLRACGRGVQCRALADAVGSKDFRRSETHAKLRDAGVELVDSLPTGLVRMLFVRADLRNHRKIAIIDNTIAYAGSQNLVDPLLFQRSAGVGEWVDAMVRIRGPAATALEAVFGLDWSLETGTTFSGPEVAAGTTDLAGSGKAIVQILPSGPDVRPESIHWSLLAAIYAARSEIVLTTPYFVPDEAILAALLSAATRGVSVTLIVPARNNSLFVRHAGVAYYDELLVAGVRIALFEGGLLHTKSLTIDGEISLFGSVNLDMRSIWLNFEISLIALDRSFTASLNALQSSYQSDSTWLDLESWRARPRRRAFLANAFRLIGPLI